MNTSQRRYDIDWLRVIAIGLLLIYHIAIGFQSWGIMIGFITTAKPWNSLWIPMSMLNVWRIPLLFFVSGMGVYFSIQNRDQKQLFLERARRILLPFVFGIFTIVPIHILILEKYNHWNLSYTPREDHLWFLWNIFSYVILLSPVLFYFKKNETGKVVGWIRKSLSNPLGVLVVMGAFVIEAIVIDPRPYELYAGTWHGYFLGLLAFFFGFCFVMSGDGFSKMILKWRWMFLILAIGLFVYRQPQFNFREPNYFLAIESILWILSILAFASRYLNYSNKALTYLSQAAYPVYILHMIFLFLGSSLIFPLDLPLPVQFVLVLAFTIAGCFAVYELIIRRVNLIRPLFGLKMKSVEPERLRHVVIDPAQSQSAIS